MTRTSTSRSAYKQTIRETEQPDEIERRIFGQITRELEKLPPGPTLGLSEQDREALARNQQLWGVMMFDVMEKENPLPEKLKAGIISLALFVDQHTPEVLAGRKTAEALIDINRNILKGMKGIAAEPELAGG